MSGRAQIRLLPDGRRLYLHDGPIDIILEAHGAPDEVQSAYRAAASRFVGVLDELCSELPILRKLPGPDVPTPVGNIAQRMLAAVLPFAADTFITPMAAVAGAVSEEILMVMTNAATLDRAYVNDGGDIALHLAPGQHFVLGMVDRPDRPSLFGSAELHAAQPVRGIATSGWRGRSFSLGIADAVTVLAERAANADAAATIIANAVDLPRHPNVIRIPARELVPDNDLGDLPVTRSVGDLTLREIDIALSHGERVARTLLERNLICATALHLRGKTRIIGGSLRTVALEKSMHDRSLIHA